MIHTGNGSKGVIMKNDRSRTDTSRLLRLCILLLATGIPHLAGAAQDSKPAWQSEWEKTVEAGKKEGQVNIYTHDGQAPILETGAFQKKYPEIKIIYNFTRGNTTEQRVFAERRAGRYLADIFIHGGTNNIEFQRAGALDPLKPALLLPEVVDESKWWLGKHPWVDPERQYIFMHIGSAQPFLFGYNSQLVNPKEFRSLRDILNPKWRGKIVAYDIRAGSYGGWPSRMLYHHPNYGPEFLKEFYGKTEVTLTRDARLALDWLAVGKFVLCFFCSDRPLREAKQQGLPVDLLDIVKDAVALASQGGAIGLPNRTPHPNAARVFLDWLLSREGQMVAQKALAQRGVPSNSMRIDITKDDVPRREWRSEGVQYVEVEHPSLLDMRPIFKIIEEAQRNIVRR